MTKTTTTEKTKVSIKKKPLLISNKFHEVLNTISDKTPIIKKLIDTGVSEKFNYHYIDITDNNDTLTFIRQNRAEQIKEEKTTYIVLESKGFSKKPSIFRKLKFKTDEKGEFILGTPEDRKKREEQKKEGVTEKELKKLVPKKGTIGKLDGYCPHPDFESYPNTILCKFVDEKDNQYLVAKSNLKEQFSPDEYYKQPGRIDIKIGKLFSSWIEDSDLKVEPKDVEDLVNTFKTTIDILKDQLKLFRIISGKEIETVGYKRDNYASATGTLGQSCMTNGGSNNGSRSVSLYLNNPEQVRLIVLKDIKDENKIRGRALLWKSDKGEYYMDRVYTQTDNLVGLFRELAKKANYMTHEEWCKGKYSADKKKEFVVTLKEEYQGTPYLDSMGFHYDNGTVNRMVLNLR